MKAPRPALTLAVLLAVAGGAAQLRAAGEIAPGAYCPIPKQGDTPKCLEPAIAKYGDFFAALASEEVDEAGLARVEGDVAAGAESEHAYLALSSLAHGYYRLSQRAAQAEGVDPEIVARLERWNALLGKAYDASAADADFRRALREAALDLQRRAPPVRLRCVDEAGETVACDSTDAVMRGIDATAGEVGIRGGLERLLQRMLGSGKS
jgi:hypothetical protein